MTETDYILPSQPKARNGKKRYSNWRDAAYDKPVNTNSSWRKDPVINPTSNGIDVFKLYEKARKQNQSGNVRTASMPPGEWIPGLVIAWGHRFGR
jgi:hypothetical protein